VPSLPLPLEGAGVRGNALSIWPLFYCLQFSLKRTMVPAFESAKPRRRQERSTALATRETDNTINICECRPEGRALRACQQGGHR
jgi:hypothetical protein